MGRTARASRDAAAGALQGTSLSDEQLVQRILQGHGADFEILVRRHQGAVFNFVVRMVHDPEEAMDLCQEIFMKIFCSLERFDPRFRFTTWMYRIASNAAIDLIRKRRPGTILSLDAPIDHGASRTREVAADGPLPDAFLEAVETREQLEQALRLLPVEYRQVLLLRHQGERRYDEIARITGLPLGTVKNRIFRAREILRKAVASC